ncbi:MAG: hypothetical protein ACREOM_12460, partial [Candidatus Dormibacteraceae bacterium]
RPGDVAKSGPADDFVPAPPAAAAAGAAAAAAGSEARATAPPSYLSPTPVAPAEPAPVLAPVHRVAVPRRPSGGLPPERPPWLVPAAAAVVVILLLGIAGFLVMHRGSGSNGGPTASSSPGAHASPKTSPKASPKTSPSPTGGVALAVPTYAPTSADPITKVQFCSTATPCSIGQGIAPETATSCDLSSCSVEVAVYFSAQQKVPVSYNFKLFDRCTGQTTDLPGPAPYTPPGYAVVIPRDHYAVALPQGLKSAALVAVSQQPTVAYSAPLLLGSDSCR